MSVLVLLAGLASVLAAVAGTCAARAWCERRQAAERRSALRRAAGAFAGASGKPKGLAETVVRYVVELSRRIAFKATRPLVPGDFGAVASGGRPRRSEAWLAEHALRAGLVSEVTAVGFAEARLRLALVFAAVGGLVGAVLSNEMAALLGVLGLFLGSAAPKWAVRDVERQRTAQAERHLSEMLEVVALGLRSGLSFDRSFQLYGAHFASPFAQACASTHRRWSMGLATREEALRGLAASYGSDQLARVVDNVVRSLRFGTSLAEGLEAAAAQARVEHRSRMEERVAKAPVKMMLPTGALILPAMLLLVLGPVLLELIDGF